MVSGSLMAVIATVNTLTVLKSVHVLEATFWVGGGFLLNVAPRPPPARANSRSSPRLICRAPVAERF